MQYSLLYFQKKRANVPSIYQRVKRLKRKRILIPEATNRKTVCLFEVETASLALIAKQEAELDIR
jgi:hypothetical protein